MGEWSRDVLLEKAEGRNVAPADQAVLSELLALHTIVLNVFFSLAGEKALTTAEMDDLIQLVFAAGERVWNRELGRANIPQARSVPLSWLCGVSGDTGIYRYFHEWTALEREYVLHYI